MSLYLSPCYRCGHEGAEFCPAAGVKLCQDCTPPAEPEPIPSTQRTLPAPQMEFPDLPLDLPSPDLLTKEWCKAIASGKITPIHSLMNLQECLDAAARSYWDGTITISDYSDLARKISEILRK